MKPHLLLWLNSGDTGLSSKAILSFMERDLTLLATINNYLYFPEDPADLGRCIRLLDIEPSYRERLHEMAEYGAEWAVLIAHWAELEALYREEKPTGHAPKCYARMRELLDPIWEKKYAR